MHSIKRKPVIQIIGLMLLTVGMIVFAYFGKPIWNPVYRRILGGRTVEQAMATYAPAAEARLQPRFTAAGVAYPPNAITLIGLKQEKQFELWANDGSGQRRIHTYPILAASGQAGPKQREGDRQVPEGVYAIEAMNPNSSYHLSMKINYPNTFDQQMAKQDKRNQLGGDIFIHGKSASVGCLAMGDLAIEELFVLTHRVGKENARILLAPHDPRIKPLEAKDPGLPSWTTVLYKQLQVEFETYRSR